MSIKYVLCNLDNPEDPAYLESTSPIYKTDCAQAFTGDIRKARMFDSRKAARSYNKRHYIDGVVVKIAIGEDAQPVALPVE